MIAVPGPSFIKGQGTRANWLLTTWEKFFLEKKKGFPACGNQYPSAGNVYLMKPRHVAVYWVLYQQLWNFYIKLCFNYLPVLWCSSFLSAWLQWPTHPLPLSSYREGLNWLVWCWAIWDKRTEQCYTVQSIHGHAFSFRNYTRSCIVIPGSHTNYQSER